MPYWEEEDEEDEEEGEGYLASYSDLVTDLMAVFVLLLSFALMSQGTKVRQTAEQLSEGMEAMTEEAQGGMTDVEQFIERLEENIKLAGLEDELSVKRNITDQENKDEQKADDEQNTEDEQIIAEQTGAHSDAARINLFGQDEVTETDIEEFIKELQQQIQDAGLDGRVYVNRHGQNRVVIRLMDSVLFDLGKADIKDEVIPVLERISGILSKYDNKIAYIHVEGHTDTLPISTSQYPSNWELSTGRAGSVVRYLIEESTLQDEKFSSAGYGEFRPIADNETEEGRSLNRRVEIFIELKEKDAKD